MERMRKLILEKKVKHSKKNNSLFITRVIQMDRLE